MERSKILFVGDSMSEQYALAFFEAAKRKPNIKADLFDYWVFWKDGNNDNPIVRFEKHYRHGILTAILNEKLIKQCEKERYDIVFLYGASMIYPGTVRILRKHCRRIAMYCNDDPFSSWYPWYVWHSFRKGLRFCDIAYSYRRRNVPDYIRYGASKVEILKSYYIKSRNYYIPDDQISMDVPEVVYIGHREHDGREGYIKALLDEGIKIGLNHAWKNFELGNDLVMRYSREEATERYNEILNKARIAIIFLSSINHDTYTRRCFEIPATKTLMIAPFTEDLAKMYEEDKEIVFFRSREEFVEKTIFYLRHEGKRQTIADNAYKRLHMNGDEVADRLDQVLKECDGF